MLQLAKLKLPQADVYDHMDFALTSLDMFAGISENLINYAFNVSCLVHSVLQPALTLRQMASYEMNIVMSRLTLVSIIFLPLTLLTGYFVRRLVDLLSSIINKSLRE